MAASSRGWNFLTTKCSSALAAGRLSRVSVEGSVTAKAAKDDGAMLLHGSDDQDN